jgi:hypothetical protein
MPRADRRPIGGRARGACARGAKASEVVHTGGLEAARFACAAAAGADPSAPDRLLPVAFRVPLLHARPVQGDPVSPPDSPPGIR